MDNPLINGMTEPLTYLDVIYTFAFCYQIDLGVHCLGSGGQSIRPCWVRKIQKKRLLLKN